MDKLIIWWLFDIKDGRECEQVNDNCGVYDRILKRLTNDITTLNGPHESTS
jgi:hypothetical protein